MRQLDLFGSLFDPTPQEDKPGENPAAPAKEEKVAETEETKERTSALSGFAASMMGANKLKKPTDLLTTIDAGKKSENTPRQPISLFDGTPAPTSDSVPPTKENISIATLHEPEATFRAEEEELATPTELPGAEIEVIVHQSTTNTTPGEQPTIAELEIPATEPQVAINLDVTATEEEEPFDTAKNEAEFIIENNTSSTKEEPLEEEPEIVASAGKKVIEKKPVTPKQKKIPAPELERTGAVIFDDGKITVKLKNKSPFPAPIVKVKREKVEKLPQKRGRKSFKEIDAEVDLIEIPEDEILFQKQYYPISEVAKWFRVNTSLLRFWENEFDVLKPRKNRKGDRLFRPEDIKNLQLIYQLLRQRKYTIEGAKEYIKTNKKKADIQQQLTTTLQKFKSFLLDLKANLQP
ncbi:MAG: transcriptional regulator [Segetibacter sp.]|nr:transcriptional regulator [Segetibacter sp.]